MFVKIQALKHWRQVWPICAGLALALPLSPSAQAAPKECPPLYGSLEKAPSILKAYGEKLQALGYDRSVVERMAKYQPDLVEEIAKNNIKPLTVYRGIHADFADFSEDFYRAGETPDLSKNSWAQFNPKTGGVIWASTDPGFAEGYAKVDAAGAQSILIEYQVPENMYVRQSYTSYTDTGVIQKKELKPGVPVMEKERAFIKSIVISPNENSDPTLYFRSNPKKIENALNGARSLEGPNFVKKKRKLEYLPSLDRKIPVPLHEAAFGKRD